MNFSMAMLLFSFYAFVGWLIECVYRSISNKTLVNAGFLFGPFVPIYGFGALIILVTSFIFGSYPFIMQFVLYTVLVSILEYVTGSVAERIFHLKLWDYTDNKFNIKGRVCLLYSLFWGGLAVFFIYLVHPMTLDAVYSIPLNVRRFAVGVLLLYFATDTICSVVSMQSFQKKVAYLYEEYFTIENIELDAVLASMQRLLRAFPHINTHLNRRIKSGIERSLHEHLSSLKESLLREMMHRAPEEKEYHAIIKDIIEHPEFLRLKEFRHHTSNIFNHAVMVSYMTYRLCKYFNLDYVSGTRGALLHDFFLYDWRESNNRPYDEKKFHGMEHPKIAFENASKYFTVNDKEKDIILKHMWPLTLRPPRFRESMIVMVVDKFIASKEFIDALPKIPEIQRSKS